MNNSFDEPIPLSELKAESDDLDSINLGAFSELNSISEDFYLSSDRTSVINEGYMTSYVRSQDVSGEPLKCQKIGGTTGQFWSNDEYSITIGADIVNPNKTLDALDVNVEIAIKDASGRILKVINDNVRSIGAGMTFHYGTQQSGIIGKPVDFSASAYARGFREAQGTGNEVCNFLNSYFRANGNWGSLTGEVHNNCCQVLEGAYLYFQFIDADGGILGGDSFWLDHMPPNGVRSIQVNGFIPDGTNSVSFSLDNMK